MTDIVASDGLNWLKVGLARDNCAPESHEKLGIDIVRSNTQNILWDIGAYHGMYALRVAKDGKTVYAFEPNPDAYKILNQNLKLNRLAAHTMNMAISSFEGTMKLTGTGPFGTANYYSFAERSFKAPCQSIDNLIMKEKMPPPDFIKIDVEQHEVEVLKGAVFTLINHAPRLLVECHRIQYTVRSHPGETRNIRLNQYLVEELLNRLGYVNQFVGEKIYATPSAVRSYGKSRPD